MKKKIGQKLEALLNRWWWDLEDEPGKGDAPGEPHGNLASTLSSYVVELQRRATGRLEADLENLRLYGAPHQSPYIGQSAYAQAGRISAASNAARVTISLVQSCVDTLTSKLAKLVVRALFITSGGDLESQNLAEKLQSFADGVCEETKAEELKLRAFVDAGIFGTGFILDFEDDEHRIGIERVFPYEIFVDDADAIYGAPRTIHRVKYVDKGKMKKMYPDFVDEISVAQGLKTTDTSQNARNNLIRVIEGWHLPSIHGADDGRHIIATNNAVLLWEKWTDDEFPLTPIRYNPKQIGYFGQGVSELLASVQGELNTLLRKIQICMHFLAVPHWLQDSLSNMQFGSFNNQIGSVIKFTGKPPELKIWQSVPPECFQHVDWLYAKGFEMSGVSQLAASSKIPGYGTMSGAALREVSDVESDRFEALGVTWKAFHIALVKRFVKRAEAIAAKNGGSYSVTALKKTPTGKADKLETIDWKDIGLQERKFAIIIEPVSKLAFDTPGNIQTGQEQVQAGLMDAETFKDFMNYPDLKAEQNLEGSARKLIHKIVFNLLDTGKWQDPDPYMDLTYAMKYATLKWNMAMADGMSSKKLEDLRTWISKVDDLIQEAKQATAPPPGAPAGAPPPGGAPAGVAVPQALAPPAQPGIAA